MSAQAQTYVVRVYQRNGGPNRELAGVVEIVHNGRRLRFDTFAQLRDILARQPSRSKARSRR
ncbi:MAG TPA: hypothetical protein VMH32_15250 [Burkholderiales bacterium]|nr:hypothetical protein [Burkholderiales bacterium]